MTERRSEFLGCNYLTVNGNYLTETGVLLSIGDVQGKSKEEVTDIYNKAIDRQKLYDYMYAKTTGHLRARRDYVKEEVALKAQKEAAQEVPKLAPVPVKKAVKLTKLLLTPISAIRAVMLAVGIGAMVTSVYYVREALTVYIHPFFATMMSITMVIFATSAFEAVVPFWHKGTKGFSIIFGSVWILVTIFMMSSTMNVNFDSYKAKNASSLQDNKEVNSGRLQLASIEAKKKIQEELIQTKKDEITAYNLKEKTSQWQKTVYSADLSKLQKDYQKLLDDGIAIQKATPDSALTKDIRKMTFYDYVGKLLHQDADFLQFLISILPALFNDIIAPLSVAMSIFLTEKKEEN